MHDNYKTLRLQLLHNLHEIAAIEVPGGGSVVL